MKNLPKVFTEDELNEIQSLQLFGGASGGASPMDQGTCENINCTKINNFCQYKACTIFSNCSPDVIDYKCTNEGCQVIIKPIDPCFIDHSVNCS